MYIAIDDSAQSIPQATSLISFGSVWLPKATFIEIENKILKLRIESDCWGEFKWTNINSSHLHIYKRLLDIFLNDDKVKFNSISQEVPSKAELRQFHGGSNETAKMKQIFNLIFYNYISYKSRFCLNKELSLIADKPFLQRGEPKEALLTRFTKPTKIPVRSAITADSKIIGILQMSDLLTGLSLVNTIKELFKKQLLEIDASKRELIAHLKSKINISPHLYGRPSPNTKCNNWFHRPGIAWKTIK